MIKVWFHAGCSDGFCAAVIASLKFGNKVAVTYTPVKYGEPHPEIQPDDEVYILDFSYPRNVLIELKGKVKNLLVLDHHKTAQADCEGLDFCKFDMSKSGAMLTWEYFNPGQPVPLVVRLVQDRDLWTKKLPDCDAAYEGLRMLGTFDDVVTWVGWKQCLIDLSFLRAQIGKGRAIVEYNQLQVKLLAKNLKMGKIGGHLVPVVNATNCISELGNYLCEKYPEFPFVAIYRDSREKRIWSLRSVGDFDVSVVAKMTSGGGGHRNASGFVTDLSFIGI